MSEVGVRAPTVRVVVPCYNYGRYLPECVASIVSQPGVDVEVVIIDDCSTDDSAVVAAGLAAADPRVSVILHEQNHGHIATYNEGLSTADTDYLVLLSADDLLAPSALDRAVRIMEDDARVGLVYGNPQEFSDEPIMRTARASRRKWRGDQWIDLQFRRGLSIIFSPEAVVRTSVHRQAGWYRSELPHSGDLEMWLRLADLGYVARVNGPDQAYRRVHEASMMRTTFAGVVRDLEERRSAYESFLGRSALSPRKVAALRRLMQRRLSVEALNWACLALSDSSSGRAEVEDEAIADAVRFAHDMSPAVSSTLVWREYRARTQFRRSAYHRALVWFGERTRDIHGRVMWRRWRYLGY